jgi:nucleoside-diphosphate-sugar epimerase
LRPAVIFGAGEGGNFTRIANALERGIFAYPGRRDTIKGCLYVKDVCRCIMGCLDDQKAYSLFNVCYPDKLTIEEIVSTIKRALGYRSPEIVLPLWSINAAALLARGIPHPAIRRMNLDPRRIAKLVHSTNISARKLLDAGFRFHYPLEVALRDWAVDCRGVSLR